MHYMKIVSYRTPADLYRGTTSPIRNHPTLWDPPRTLCTCSRVPLISHTHKLTHAHTHTLSHSHSHTPTSHTLTHKLTLTHSHAHILPHAPARGWRASCRPRPRAQAPQRWRSRTVTPGTARSPAARSPARRPSGGPGGPGGPRGTRPRRRAKCSRSSPARRATEHRVRNQISEARRRWWVYSSGRSLGSQVTGWSIGRQQGRELACQPRGALSYQRGTPVLVRNLTRPSTVSGAGVQGAGCRVQGSGCEVQGAWCRVKGAWCRVQGAGCGVWGMGCKV